jgi:hypothetical protein
LRRPGWYERNAWRSVYPIRAWNHIPVGSGILDRRQVFVLATECVPVGLPSSPRPARRYAATFPPRERGIAPLRSAVTFLLWPSVTFASACEVRLSHCWCKIARNPGKVLINALD